MSYPNMLKTFKIIAILEGISLLLLFFFAMPMKYLFDKPEYVRFFGMGHGLLFIAYIVLAVMLKYERDWPAKKLAIVCVASVLPFGTFYIESRYLKTEA
jgi:integral membrane protein